MVYSIIITIIALILAIIALKWKISTRAMVYFCMKYFRQPTNEEIADCSKRVISEMLHIKKSDIMYFISKFFIVCNSKLSTKGRCAHGTSEKETEGSDTMSQRTQVKDIATAVNIYFRRRPETAIAIRRAGTFERSVFIVEALIIGLFLGVALMAIMQIGRLSGGEDQEDKK